MKLLKETSRKILIIPNYIGICHNCNSPIEYPDKLVLIEIATKDNKHTCVCIDTLACPHCLQTITGIELYLNMDVTKELSESIKEK